jgi:hypothetical protein
MGRKPIKMFLSDISFGDVREIDVSVASEESTSILSRSSLAFLFSDEGEGGWLLLHRAFFTIQVLNWLSHRVCWRLSLLLLPVAVANAGAWQNSCPAGLFQNPNLPSAQPTVQYTNSLGRTKSTIIFARPLAKIKKRREKGKLGVRAGWFSPRRSVARAS